MNTPTAPSDHPAPAAPAVSPYDRRPTPPVKVTYTTTWLHFLAVLCLLVAWWVPVKVIMNRVLWPRVEPRGPRDSEAFVAIAYEGVSTRTNEVQPAQFREHIETLQAAGYVPISLRDVEALYYENRPLPRKAVLVTFDLARKTSYFDTHAILRRTGWRAVMFLWTRPIVERDPAALLWPYVRNMIRSGVWEIGAESHNGFLRITNSPRGRVGNFMTSPTWRADEQRFETLEEFQQRLEQDHAFCLSLIEKNLGIRPIAYAFPYGDFGQYQHRAILTRPINLGLVNRYYRLGFTLGNLALNTRYSDPSRLNRLLVRPEWSGRDLLERLERAWPMDPSSFDRERPAAAAPWVVDWGLAEETRDGALVLRAPTNATGAKVWLAGSDLSRNFQARIRFELRQGQLGVYLRASPDTESYVYIGLDPSGEVWLRQLTQGSERVPITESAEEVGVWLRQKQVGAERFTLASSKVQLNPGVPHVLDVYLRDRLLFARLDGRELFQNRALLRGETRPGMVGFSVWAPGPGQAAAVLRSLEVRPQSPTLAMVPYEPRTQPAVARWVHSQAFRLTDLSPLWLPRGGVAAPMSKEQLELYRLLARVNHLQFVPQMVVEDETALTRIAPSQVAERAVSNRFDGILVNFGHSERWTPQTLAAWLRQCQTALATNGLQLLVQLPPSMETRTQVASLLAVAPGLRIVASAASALATSDVARTSAVVRAEAVPVGDKDEEIPLFFMIPPGGPTSVADTPEARSARLQQEGLAAFLERQYDRALELWKQWRDLEPDNPKVHMLIGDALARKGDLRGAGEAYDRSLELDPGQVGLAVRRANLYTQLGEPERAMEMLNLYARLFPGNPDVLMAQARWLHDQQRYDEAAQALRKLVSVETNHVEAMAMLVRLTSSPTEYRALMNRLAAAASDPSRHLALAQAAWRYELLSLPESRSLVQALREIAARTSDEQTREICVRLLPNDEPIVENLASGALSSRWWLDGCTAEARPGGGVRLKATEAHTEASARALGTLHQRNACIDAEIEPVSGSAWLYACRTERHLIRFGISDGQLRLQAWRNNRLLQDLKQDLPADAARRLQLRLEVNGKAAMGFLEGRPAFPTRLNVPDDFGGGWVGLAAHAPERGRAVLDVFRLRVNGCPLRLAMVPSDPTPEATDARLAKLRSDVPWLTAMCPSWWQVTEEGRWISASGVDAKVFEIFSKYHRVPLLPLVECRSMASITPEALAQRAADCRADGFVLGFRRWPDAAWLDSLASQLQGSPLTVLVLAPEEGKGVRVQAVSGSIARGVLSVPQILRAVQRDELSSMGDPSQTQGLIIGY